MQSSGKIASSAPSARARPIHSATFAALPSIVADGGVDLGEGYAHRCGPGSSPKYRRQPRRASRGPARWPLPMRSRGRQLVGISGPRLLLRARLLPGAAAGRAGLLDGVPALASPRRSRSSRRARGRPKPAGARPTIPTPTATPTPSPRRRGRPPATPTSASTGSPRASTRRTSPTPTATASPTTSNACSRVAEHVHTVENGKLGWREPLSDGTRGGGHGKTDIYLSEIGGQLFGYAAPDRDQATKRHRMPRRLHGYLVLDNDYSPFEFPHTTPVARPRGDPRPRVQPHPPVRLRRLPGPLVRRVDARSGWRTRSTTGSTTTCATSRRWVKPLGHAADRELDQGVRHRRSGTSGCARRYGRSIIRKAWARAIHARPGGFSVNAYESAIRAAGPPTFGRDFTRFAAAVAEWRTGSGFRESDLYPDMPRQGRLPLGGPAGHPPPQPHHLRACSASTAPPAAPSSSTSARPSGTAAGLALVGRIGSERHGRHGRQASPTASGGGRLTVRLPDPAASAGSPRSSSTPTPRPHGYSAAPPRLALPDRRDAVRDQRPDRCADRRRLPFAAGSVRARLGGLTARGAVAIVSSVAASRSSAKLSRSAIAS